MSMAPGTALPVPKVPVEVSVSALDSMSYARHRWYFYKEAFSPDLIRYAIEAEELDRNAVIFDPFAGSGTTILEAAIQGRTAWGYEVNPFVAAVARAKLCRSKAPQLRLAASLALGGAMRGRRSRLEGFSTFTQVADSTKWLFNRSVIRAFSGAWEALSGSRSSHALAIRIALIGAAMDCSNARKDGKCLRYKHGWDALDFNASDFLDAFGRRVAMMAEDLEVCALKNDGEITLADSRKRPLRRRFDLCITSPPYLNSFDYTDVYRPELFLGEYVSNMDELSALRRRTIRSHVQVRWTDPKQADFGSIYQETLKNLAEHADGLWNPRIPLMIQAYFEDMQKVLGSLRNSVQTHGAAWLVVSTSSYAGVEIPVDEILAQVAERERWQVRSVRIVRHLDRIANQQWVALQKGSERPQLRESVVILDAKEA